VGDLPEVGVDFTALAVAVEPVVETFAELCTCVVADWLGALEEGAAAISAATLPNISADDG
jgi:hypothetical protein